MASDPPAAGAGGVLRVALPVPVHRLFDYLPPPGPVPGVGCRVRVPFGRRELVGVVVGHGAPEPGPRGELKQAIAAPDPAPLVSGELLASLRWLARYTHAALGEVLATALPGSLRHGEPLPDVRPRGWQLTAAGRDGLDSMRAGRPKALAEALAAGALDEDSLAARVEGWRAAARTLEQRGLAGQ
ncbi:primosomal protein N', partial [Bacillus tequilensis]|nr:primosomal protein N' [Bacillus tequilensis]